MFFKRETLAPLSIVRKIYFKPPNRSLVQAITHTAHIFFASKLPGGFQGSDRHPPAPQHCCGSLEEHRKVQTLPSSTFIALHSNKCHLSVCSASLGTWSSESFCLFKCSSQAITFLWNSLTRKNIYFLFPKNFILLLTLQKHYGTETRQW